MRIDITSLPATLTTVGVPRLTTGAEIAAQASVPHAARRTRSSAAATAENVQRPDGRSPCCSVMPRSSRLVACSVIFPSYTLHQWICCTSKRLLIGCVTDQQAAINSPRGNAPMRAAHSAPHDDGIIVSHHFDNFHPLGARGNDRAHRTLVARRQSSWVRWRASLARSTAWARRVAASPSSPAAPGLGSTPDRSGVRCCPPFQRWKRRLRLTLAAVGKVASDEET